MSHLLRPLRRPQDSKDEDYNEKQNLADLDPSGLLKGAVVSSGSASLQDRFKPKGDPSGLKVTADTAEGHTESILGLNAAPRGGKRDNSMSEVVYDFSAMVEKAKKKCVWQEGGKDKRFAVENQGIADLMNQVSTSDKKYYVNPLGGWCLHNTDMVSELCNKSVRLWDSFEEIR